MTPVALVQDEGRGRGIELTADATNRIAAGAFACLGVTLLTVVPLVADCAPSRAHLRSLPSIARQASDGL
eukprot:1533854-Prymnesium_polylepis.4